MVKTENNSGYIWALRLNLSSRLSQGDRLKVLFASCVISVAFCFWSVLYFFGSLLMVLFALFYSHKHPIVLFINASAN